MGKIFLETFINAPIERCFDLSRSVDMHIVSASHTQERAIAGVTTGLMNLGDRVTWEAFHFQIRQQLEVEIIEMHRPASFTDIQIKGIFKSFSHRHQFESRENGTMMTDEFDFVCPFGFLGALVADKMVTRHLRKFLRQRNNEIKRIAESEAWREILK